MELTLDAVLILAIIAHALYLRYLSRQHNRLDRRLEAIHAMLDPLDAAQWADDKPPPPPWEEIPWIGNRG